MSELQGKFRCRKTNFATVSNSALQDSKLSLKAKGLYAMIQSYINIPDYNLYKWCLLKLCREGERAFDSAWKELKEHGYLKLYRMPGRKRGQFVYEYELLDVADQSISSTINLNAKGEPKAPDDHTLQNVPYGQENYEDEKSSDHTLHFAPYAPSTLCKGVSQSRDALKKRLGHVDEEDVVGFLAHMRDRSVIPKNIRNIGAYWKSAFVNYISEQALAVAGL